MKNTSILLLGLGPLGQRLLPFLQNRADFSLVGAVDTDPAKQQLSLGIKIWPSVEAALKEKKVEVAVLTTVSSLAKIVPQIVPLLEKKISVVSTCEELVFPWKTNPELAQLLDQKARAHDSKVLATGVNPGFLMDYLAVVAMGLCEEVKRVRIERVQDASLRRLPFQQKIGAGLSVEEFQKKVQDKSLRHVGLTESMHMIAAALGWDLERTEESIVPIIGPQSCQGVVQEGRAYRGGEEVLHLYFRAGLNESHPHEEIWVQGKPDFRLQIPGGINGDHATCAVISNAIHKLSALSSGLKTMLDLPPLSPGRLKDSCRP